MRKFILIAAAVIALLALHIRLQPPGSAAVYRSGNRLFVRRSIVFIRPFRRTTWCRVPTVGGQLAFDQRIAGHSSSSDEFPMRVRLQYDAPEFLPSNWPMGDWCTSLAERVRATVSQPRVSVESLLDHRRDAGDRIAAVMAADLRGANVRTRGISVRVDLPAGFERLRPVAVIEANARRARPVIFIGLDGADWQLLDDYMDRGVMPNLKRLVSTGAGGILETEHPPLSPLVWNTMMTGVGPLEHGILDFTRFNPYTHEKEPITSDERRVPAIWNMLTWAGKSVACSGCGRRMPLSRCTA